MARHTVSHIDSDHAAKLAERIPTVGVGLLLGAFIILSAGFAPIGAIHNAAHDARHSFAFPCH